MERAHDKEAEERQSQLEVRLELDTVPAIHASGELDFYNRQKLAVVIDTLFTQNIFSFVLNLTDLTFLDSSGLGLIILTQRKINEKGGTMPLVPSSPVNRMINLMKLEQIFLIFPDLKGAKESLLAPSS